MRIDRVLRNKAVMAVSAVLVVGSVAAGGSAFAAGGSAFAAGVGGHSAPAHSSHIAPAGKTSPGNDSGSASAAPGAGN